jgi:hypothetical protein
MSVDPVSIKRLHALGPELRVKHKNDFISEIGVGHLLGLLLQVGVQIVFWLVLRWKDIVHTEFAFNLVNIDFFDFHVVVEVDEF